jgi:hypothetical protein
MELLSKGENNQSEIARILQADKSIVCRDIAYLRDQAKSNIKKYFDERLPEEYEKYLVGLTAITNATVVDDAIRFVSDRSKKKLESSDEDDKESKQHDYDEDKDQLEIEQEEETGETTNQVF